MKAINWESYNRRPITRYLAQFPLSWDRYTRLNDYYDYRGLGVLQMQDHPNEPNYYLGCLISASGENYIEFLERINILQTESKLLSIPFELEEKFNDLLITDIIGLSSLDSPGITNYPFVISGNIDNVNTEGLFVIKDPLALYFPVLNIIMIDLNKITEGATSRVWNTPSGWRYPNFSAFYEIVLRHEIGHWLSHELLVEDLHMADDIYMSAEESVHEFYAQLLAYNLLEEESEIQRYMDFIAEDQEQPYQLYQEYSGDLSVANIRELLIRRNKMMAWNDLKREIHDIKGWTPPV